MREKFRKVVAFSLTASILSSAIIGELNSYATADDSTYVETYVNDSYSDDTFIGIDADGNVTLTPIDDVEAISVEELESMDNVEYEVVLEVEGEEIVLATLSTEAEAEEEAEVVQEIIDTETTTEAILVEVGLEEEVITAIVEGEEIPEIVVEEEAEQDITDENLEEEAASNTLVFSSSVESISTNSYSNTTIQVSVKEAKQEVSYGVVIISGYVEYKNEDGVTVSANGSYAPDAAYLGTVNSTYIFRQSGASGYISTSSAYVIEYDTFIKNGNIVSTYTTSNGKLYHNITTDNKTIASTIMVGYQESYMSSNATYYSYDGHYFYTDYKTMVTDYKNGTYLNSINASNPYYNYYQYLSQRSTTNFTADQINEYLEYRLGSNSTSVLLGTGSDFISNQNTYGVNAILTLGIAINESAWGTSSIATSKLNIFGHGAYDNNVYNAYTYSSISACIAYHCDTFMSQGYADPKNWKYNGANLGDKDGGANIYYASDPYWAEKACAQAYLMEDYFSDQTYDYESYTIGITSELVYAYNELGGTSVYNTYSGNSKIVDNFPVIILDSVTYNGELWYKIQSDGVLTSGRSSVSTTSGKYDFSRDYVYVKAESITIVYEADGSVEEDDGGSTGGTVTYLPGDVNGDGERTASDYMLIKNYILGKSTLTSERLERADVNGDGSISASDYMLIKNHILGKTSLD